jgi:hypothetical protein
MTKKLCLRIVAVFALVLLYSSLGKAADITVDCSNPKAKVKTITAALAQLVKTVENTVHVSGACNEWVRITNFENLTLDGNSGASISAPTTPPPASDGTYIVLWALDSGNVAVKGFTINGPPEGDAVTCTRVRSCSFENDTIQGGLEGVVATWNTYLLLMEDTIQDNTAAGVAVSSGVNATIYGGIIQRNGQGINMFASTLLCHRYREPMTIQNNSSLGVLAGSHSVVSFGTNAVQMTSNGNAAISLGSASVAYIGSGNVITSGSGSTVQIGDLSLATIRSGATVSGGSPFDVECVGKNSVASGGGLAGLSTNCTP